MSMEVVVSCMVLYVAVGFLFLFIGMSMGQNIFFDIGLWMLGLFLASTMVGMVVVAIQSLSVVLL